MALPRRSDRSRKSSHTDDYVYGHNWSVPKSRTERRTPQEDSDEWPILEVVRRVDEHHVEVKWAPTKRVWPNSVIDLRYNTELRDSLQRNCCNPSMKVFKEQQVQVSQHRELRVLRQQIFDNLGYRYTPSRTQGHVRRLTVVVPFSKENFRGIFLQQLSLPVCQELLEEKNLENCFGGRAINVPAENMGEVDTILGDHWDVRTFPTNTVCRVVRMEGIHISWGYKRREMFSHSNCPRCTWAQDSDDDRPELCSPTVSYMVGEPELHFTFSRRRGRWMAGLM
ncbi:hypothetical protein Bbelb_272360 [Branchiostoma belcheri]|nr:hypothetical protein Bbelb_272360 [Branchiostoma belcheri]